MLLSLAAHLLEILRYFAYGLVLASAAVAGEWLWREGLASHHGFPVMYGAAAAIVALGGLARLLLLTYLYVVDGADFTYLRNQTGQTWGNQSAHLGADDRPWP